MKKDPDLNHHLSMFQGCCCLTHWVPPTLCVSLFVNQHLWNKLSEEVVDAGGIATFKKHLGKYMDRTGLEGYGPNAGRWV